MAGADEGGQRLARHADEFLVERHPLVALQNRGPGADLPVAAADDGGHMGDLVAAGLPLADGSSEEPEGLDEEGFDEMELERITESAIDYVDSKIKSILNK